MERQIETLDGIDILSGLTPAQRGDLSTRCAWREFKSKQLIVSHQESSRNVYFLVRGKARAIIYSAAGRQVTFRDIRPGEMFGEFAAIDGEPRSASVEASQKCLIATMTPDLFWDVLRTCPSVSASLLKRLTRQVRVMSERIYEFSTLAARNRIHAELLRLAEAAKPEAAGRVVLLPAPTHADIASRISAQRETVTRELSEMALSGVIEQHGRTLVVKDIEALRRMVHQVAE